MGTIRLSGRARLGAFVAALLVQSSPLAGCLGGVPSLVFLTPQSGSFAVTSPGSCIPVEGVYANFDATAHPILLHLNQVPVPGATTDPQAVVATLIPSGASRSNGRFEACVPVDYSIVSHAEHPLNTIFAEAATMSPPVRGSVTLTVGTHNKDWASTGDGLALKINQSGLGAVAASIGGAFTGAIDLEAMVLGANPLIQGFQVIPGLSIDGNATSVTHGAISVDVLPLGPSANPGNRTLVTIHVPNLAVEFLATDSPSNPSFQCHGTLSATELQARVWVDQLPNGPVVDVVQLATHSTPVPGWVVTFPPSPGNLCGYPSFQSYLQSTVVPGLTADVDAMVTSALADPDGAGPADSLVAGAIEGALADISLASAIEPALGVTLNGEISGIRETDDAGLVYQFTVEPTPDSTLCTTAGLFTQACPLLGSNAFHVPFAASTPSTWDVTTPVAGVAYDLAFGLGPNAFNHLFRVMTMQGKLATELTEMPSCVNVPPGNDETLTAQCLFGAQTALTGLGAADPLRVRGWMVVPPTLTGDAGIGGAGQRLAINGLMVQVDRLMPGGPVPLVRILVRVDASLSLGYDSNANELSFELATCTASPPLPCGADAWGVTLFEDFPGPILSATLLDLFLNFPYPPAQDTLLETTVLPLLASSLFSFPVPTFSNFYLTPVEETVSEGMQAVFATMHPGVNGQQ